MDSNQFQRSASAIALSYSYSSDSSQTSDSSRSSYASASSSTSTSTDESSGFYVVFNPSPTKLATSLLRDIREAIESDKPISRLVRVAGVPMVTPNTSPESLRRIESVISKLLAHDIDYENLETSDQYDPAIAMAAVKINWWNIEHVPHDITNRDAIFRAAIEQNGFCMYFATDSEKADLALISLAIDTAKRNDSCSDAPTVLAYASNDLQKNEALFDRLLNSAEIKKNPSRIFEELFHDKERVLKAITLLNCDVLYYASTIFKSDPDIHARVASQYGTENEVLEDLVSESFFSKDEHITAMLRRSPYLLESFPEQIADNPKYIRLAKENGYEKAGYSSSKVFKCDILNIANFKIYDVLPTYITENQECNAQDLVQLVRDAPSPIAVYGASIGLGNAKYSAEFECLYRELFPSLPMYKQLALEAGLSNDLVHFNEDEKSDLVGKLYLDKRVLVPCSHDREYISKMTQWLARHGIKTYSIDHLFTESRAITLFDTANENSVIFIGKEDIATMGSSLNGLLESDTWVVNSLCGKIAPKIVVVADPAQLSLDILSRLQCHADRLSIQCGTKKIYQHDASVKLQESTALCPKAQPIIERNADTLLSTRYTSVQDYYRTLQSEGVNQRVLSQHPLITSTTGELSLLDKHLFESGLTPRPLAYIPSMFPVVSSIEVEMPSFDPGALNWVFLDSATNLDDLIDAYLNRYIQSTSTQHSSSKAAIFSQANIFVNARTNAHLYSKVFIDPDEDPHIIYRGDAYDVKTLQHSRFKAEKIAPESNSSSQFENILSRSEQKILKNYFRKGKVDTANSVAKKIFSTVTSFLNKDQFVLIIEGEPGIGKDIVSRHLLKQFCALKHGSVETKHFTAGYDLLILDELIRLRLENPDRLLVVIISEGNLCDIDQWQDVKIWLRQDQRTKIIATQNSVNLGNRFDLTSLFPKEQTLNLSEWITPLSSKVNVYKTLERNYELSQSAQTSVSSLHLLIKSENNSVTNRQTESLYRILTHDRMQCPASVYEGLYRVYGHYPNSQKSLFVGELINSDGKVDYKSGSKLKANQPEHKSDSYYDDSSYPVHKFWNGQNCSFLTDVFPKNAKVIYGPHPVYKSIANSIPLSNGETITLQIFPGQKGLNFYLCESDNNNQVMQANLDNIEKITSMLTRTAVSSENEASGERITFTNNFGHPVAVYLAGHIQLTKYSSTQSANVRYDFSIHLSAVEMVLIDALIKHSSLLNKIDVDTNAIKSVDDYEIVNWVSNEQIIQLSNLLGVQNPNDSQQIIKDLFRFFNGFSKGAFHIKPVIDQDIPEKYVHLLHACLSKVGVCRHQSALMQVFLKVYGIKSTYHENDRHAFLTLADNTILDVNYFASELEKSIYNKLVAAHDTARLALNSAQEHLSQKHTQLKVTLRNLIDQTQPVIDFPHNKEVTLEKISDWTTQLENASQAFSRETNPTLSDQSLSDSLSKTNKTIDLDYQRLGTHKVTKGMAFASLKSSVTDVHADKKRMLDDQIKITPENVINMLQERKIEIDQLIPLIKEDSSLGYQPWLDVLQNDRLIAPPAKRHRLDHSPTSADYTYGFAKNQLITAMVTCMLEDLPRRQKTFHQYFPKLEGVRLPARARDVGNFYLVSMTKPASTSQYSVCFDFPQQYTKPYVFFGCRGPVNIANEEQHRVASNREQRFSLTPSLIEELTRKINNN